MKVEIMKELVDKIIETELNHIREDKEVPDLKDNKELQEIMNKREYLINILRSKLSADLIEILNNLVNNLVEEQSLHEQYYFREGVNAGMGNLKYLIDFGLNIAL